MSWRLQDVLAFRRRDWDAFARASVTYTSLQSEVLAGSLHEQARAAIPGWPTQADRDDDLAAHVRLVDIFRRVANAERGGLDAR